MALHFHQLTVKKIQKETGEAVCVSFQVPEKLKKKFAFKQGQNITLKKIINGEEIRRSYSICTSPSDDELKVGIKKTFNGLFSTYANTQLSVGDVLEVMPPSGKFYTDLNAANKKGYVAFAAGSGITPILSILKTTLAIEPLSTFTLIYGSKNHTSIMFKNELEALKDKYINRFALHYILSREKIESDINYGRIDALKCKQFARLIKFKAKDEFFICGPEEMTFGVKNFLEDEKVDKKKIHFELFTTPTRQNIIYNADKVKELQNSSQITIKLDGRSFEFSLDYNSNNILDAALAHGADLPFSCKGGVCTTCKARLVKGEVQMEVNYGLEADEVEAGYILTCQSHPRSNTVVVDFDVK